MPGHRAAIACVVLCLVPSLVAASGGETGTFKTADGVAIYYERYGTGPQVVVVPNRLYMPEFRELARPGRTLILYDMRNRGKSQRVEDAANITIEADVQDLEALRRHFGFSKMSVVGYSYLGLMVALYATEHPEHVERVVQIGAVPRKFGTAYPADQVADLSSLDADGQAALAAWRALRDRKPRTASAAELCRAQAAFLAYMLVGNPANHTKVPDVCVYENEHYDHQVRHMDAHFADIQKREYAKDRFTTLPHPVLTIHGTLDRNAPYGAGVEWAATFRNARLITVEGGAHQVWLDDPAVLRDIDAFLSGNWPARAQRFGRD